MNLTSLLQQAAARQNAAPQNAAQMAAQASAQFNAAYGSQYSQAQQALYSSSLQQQAAAQHQLMQQYNQAQQMRAAEWMIAGRVMTFDEFVDTLYPEDCAEKTYIILKLKGTEND